MEKFFSIILSIYNVEDYLKRCIDSILDQKFTDYEIILVDDGSTDSSSEICDEYCKSNSNIKVVHKENGGLSSARNSGLEVADGKYIFWVDADDWLESDALQILYNKIQEYYPDIVTFNHCKRPSDEKVISSLKKGIYYKEQLQEDIVPKILNEMWNYNFSVWSHVYKREYIKQFSFVSERVIGSEDFLFNLTVYSYAESVLSIENCLYNYDYRPGSLVNRYRKNLIVQYLELYNRFCQVLNDTGNFQKYRSQLANFYVWSSYWVSMGNECKFTKEHTKKDGRQNIKMLLSQKEFRENLRLVSFREQLFKRKLILILLYMKATSLIMNILK